ncbi:MAG: J domain-containing protein [Candidatus Brocadiaceae bacterium]|nr:J domain-containing protein [Candidatus Brocadiaceae bacterium]
MKALTNSLNQDTFQTTGVALKLLATYKSRYRAKSVVSVGAGSIVLSSCSATKLTVERIDETTTQWRHELDKKPHSLLLMQDTILTVIPDWEADTTAFIAMYSSGKSAYRIHVNGCRTLASINRRKNMCTIIVSDCDFTHSRAYILSPSGVANEIDLNSFQATWQYICPFSSEDWIVGSGNELYIISANGTIDRFWQTEKVSRQVPPGLQWSEREDNAFQTLEIDRTADESAIKDAYKRLARRWHPDVNDDPRATRIMQDINAAYEILIPTQDAPRSISGSFSDYYDFIDSICSSAKGNRLVVITGSLKLYHWRSRQLIKTHQFKESTSVLAVLEDGSTFLWDGNFIRFQENGTMVTIPHAILGKTFESHPNACLTPDEGLLWVYSQDQRRVMIFDPRQPVFLGNVVFPTRVRAIEHATTDDSVLVVSDYIYHIRLQPREC